MSEPRPDPPLRDAHAHVAQHGRSLSMLDLSTCRSAAEALERIARASASLADERWLIAQGARPEGWREGAWPTLAELDTACGGRPCAAWCFDYHGMMASSRALALAGIDQSSADPPGGVVVREGGRLRGVVLERAAHAVWEAVPEPGEAERREHVGRALADMAELGFAEVHDLLAAPWLGPLLAELDDAGELPLAAELYVAMEHLEAVAAGSEAWRRGRVRLAGGKIFVDGTLNSRTALMLEPYADPLEGLPRGRAMVEAGAIDGAIESCVRRGLQLAAHAIGDGAVRMVLDAVERVRPPARSVRIEHAEVIDEADVGRFAALGVVCSVQPCHLLADVEALRRLVPGRLHRVLPLRELIEEGCEPGELLLFGSDTPIVRPNPEDNLQAALHRSREGEDAIAPEQSVTYAEALAAMRPGT